VETSLVVRSADGGLRVRLASGDSNQDLEPELGITVSETQLAFYRENYVVLLDAAGNQTAD
jgi:hypothetical protein